MYMTAVERRHDDMCYLCYGSHDKIPPPFLHTVSDDKLECRRAG